MTPGTRAAIAVYMAAGQHLDGGDAAAPVKSIRVIARELGMSSTTVRRWLKANHPDLWLMYWQRQ